MRTAKDYRVDSMRIEHSVFREGELSVGLTLPLLEAGNAMFEMGGKWHDKVSNWVA